MAQSPQPASIVITAWQDDAYGGDTNQDGQATLPAPGSWDSLQIEQTGRAELSHTILRYGGRSDGIIQVWGGSLTLDQSRLEQSYTSAISATPYHGTSQAGRSITRAGRISVRNSFIGHNGGSGVSIYAEARTQIDIVNNAFKNNRAYPIAIRAATTESRLPALMDLSHNVATQNGYNMIHLSGSYIRSTRIKAIGLPYDVDLVVLPRQTLTLDAG